MARIKNGGLYYRVFDVTRWEMVSVRISIKALEKICKIVETACI